MSWNPIIRQPFMKIRIIQDNLKVRATPLAVRNGRLLQRYLTFLYLRVVIEDHHFPKTLGILQQSPLRSPIGFSQELKFPKTSRMKLTLNGNLIFKMKTLISTLKILAKVLKRCTNHIAIKISKTEITLTP